MAGGSNCEDYLISCRSGEAGGQVACNSVEPCFGQILVEEGCLILFSLN